MKFGRYLEKNQTPEWKKAYIDYRALKKQINSLRKAQESLSSDPPCSEPSDDRVSEASHQLKPAPKGYSAAPEPSGDHTNLAIPQEPVPPLEHVMFGVPPRVTGPSGSTQRYYGVVGKPRRGPVILDRSTSLVADFRRELEMHPEDDENLHELVPWNQVSEGGHDTGSSGSASWYPIPSRVRLMFSTRDGPPLAYSTSLVSIVRRGQSIVSRLGYSGGSQPTNPMELLPLKDLLAQLDPPEQAFFTALDTQLDKIESFYTARESEMMTRSKILRGQLEELEDHKKLVQAVHPKNPSPWSSAFVASIKGKLKSKQAFEPAVRAGEIHDARDGNVDLPRRHTSVQSESLASRKGKYDVEANSISKRSIGRQVGVSSDPEDYLYAKKKLKKAVPEHYRGLEVLQNYRILNLTGFHKVLKKFEKITKIKAQRQYMSEKVEQSAFASDENVQRMMQDMENLYATRFARGDKKRAMTRLRAGVHSKSHHYSVFRSGILVGLALAALVSGIHASFLESTRDAIPGWDGLLYIYGVMLPPVLLSLLVGANLMVWARARINYIFLFRLDNRTRMDYREFCEIPSVLLAALCYAFWCSFLQIGAPRISPTIWPLVWLGFCALVMLNPIPVLYRSSRYWLLRNIGKLLISGTRRVEFVDFWMGDQFCSLAFSLSNMCLVGCVYARGFDSEWAKCGVAESPRWYIALILASLPLLIRVVQSVTRYYESGLVTHLINGGKYGVGIISNVFFYIWQHQGTTRHGAIYVHWLLLNTVSSTYSTSWDFLMDWSVLRWRARYPILRPELLYTESIPLYYIAIITNFLIRFIWVIYIPRWGPNMFVRSFIAGILEMLRRWLWNFYRLENEHLGNMDQYRVTHDVPLPYSFDDAQAADPDDADDDDDDDDQALLIAAARVRDDHRARLGHLGAGVRVKKVG